MRESIKELKNKYLINHLLSRDEVSIELAKGVTVYYIRKKAIKMRQPIVVCGQMKSGA